MATELLRGFRPILPQTSDPPTPPSKTYLSRLSAWCPEEAWIAAFRVSISGLVWLFPDPTKTEEEAQKLSRFGGCGGQLSEFANHCVWKRNFLSCSPWSPEFHVATGYSDGGKRKDRTLRFKCSRKQMQANCKSVLSRIAAAHS